MKYRVTFEFLRQDGTWKAEYLNDNENGLNLEDAKSIAMQLKTTSVCITRNIEIEPMWKEGAGNES